MHVYATRVNGCTMALPWSSQRGLREGSALATDVATLLAFAGATFGHWVRATSGARVEMIMSNGILCFWCLEAFGSWLFRFDMAILGLYSI